SFGTFNNTAAEEGRELFFSKLNRVFREDDCTFLGCAAVLSDIELSYDGNDESSLPYLGPTANAEVFSSSSVEALSLSHDRTNICGEEGLNDTKTALDLANIPWTDTGKAFYTEEAGVRIGILSVKLPDNSTVDGLAAWAASASEKCGYTVIYAERQEGSDEMYTEIAKRLIDAGCDLVCYTGYAPEEGLSASAYNGGIVVNSLGYLLDGGSFTAADTALFRVTLTADNGTIIQIEGETLPITYPDNPWIPTAE
ncbi:MAG: hypothetical protein E7638_04085, partial [Ruminococcaceae bacterium]|nr:hypothetical protein [Oscillospiraceae bacterium]